MVNLGKAALLFSGFREVGAMPQMVQEGESELHVIVTRGIDFMIRPTFRPEVPWMSRDGVCQSLTLGQPRRQRPRAWYE